MPQTKAVLYYQAYCSGCFSKLSDGQGTLLFPMRNEAISAAIDAGWQTHRNRLFCPTCLNKQLHISPRKRNEK
ncbi:MAG: hypothetical protein IJE18_06305 [Bacteroidaceae bacterium]|nr:hypothetical protein [Bacteroidaceae bacterium]MBQ3196547.1 hypothetical protein [Alistipes sp.]